MEDFFGYRMRFMAFWGYFIDCLGHIEETMRKGRQSISIDLDASEAQILSDLFRSCKDLPVELKDLFGQFFDFLGKSSLTLNLSEE